MEIRCAENIVLVEIEKRMQDTDGNILIDPSWHPEEYATLEGIVYSVPHRFFSDSHRTIVGSVDKGDKVVFSYATLFDYIIQPDNDTPVYKNLVIHEGKELWKVEYGEVFCKVIDGKIIMITDNILLEKPTVIQVPRGTFLKSMRFIMPQEPVRDDIGTIIGMPQNKELSYNMGDRVAFESKYTQKYKILDRELYLIPSRRILAKIA